MDVYSYNRVNIKKLDDYYLVKDTNTNCELFWNSFQILNHRIEKNLLQIGNVKIYGKSFITLKNYLLNYNNILPYDECVKILGSLYSQTQEMYRNGILVPFFDLDSIVKIDNDYYYINSFKIIYEKNNEYLYTRPFKRNIFISPEIDSGMLPIRVDFGSTLYSLACLVGHCLTNSEITYSNKVKKLDFINHSKLFFCLQRLLFESKQSRVFFFI